MTDQGAPITAPEATPSPEPPSEVREQRFLQIRFTPMDVADAAEQVKALGRADLPFRYIVTPNADTTVKYHGMGTKIPVETVRESYDRAWLCTVDSKIISLLARLKGYQFPVCTGADLTAFLLDRKIYSGDDPITILGGDETLIADLVAKYDLRNIHHYNPPFGFWKDPEEVRKSVEAICARPSGLILFAVGNPQQELVALNCLKSGNAYGMGLCVGASLDFLTGRQKRAPEWMSSNGLEWFYRLLTNPERMWRRYLLHSPKVFWIFLKTELFRKKT
ncbi:MAG: WecB/TagA/CpsF family glycosyltransferase [Rhodospirillaceae bacterium]